MIPLARHTGQVLAADRVPILDPVAIEIAAEETWSPRFQGRLTLHGDDLALLPDRVIIRLRAAYGSDLSIAALTEWAGGSVASVTARTGGDVAELTARHTRPWNQFETTQPLAYLTGIYGGDVGTVTAAHGGTLAAVTAVSRQPGGAYLPPPAQHVEVRLRVRQIMSRERDALHDVTLTGEDIALHDYRRMSSTTYTSPHVSLRALVLHVLDYVDGTLAPSADASIPAGTEWAPGQTAWDMLHAVLEKAGWTLWADEDGIYRLDQAPVVVSDLELDAERNLIEWDAEAAPIEDAVVVEYTGVEPPVYDIYEPIGAQRTRLETRETSYPGAGAAEQIALRAATRARTARAIATSLYELRPLDRVTCRPPGVTADATVSSVEWKYPEATMVVRLRDII